MGRSLGASVRLAVVALLVVVLGCDLGHMSVLADSGSDGEQPLFPFDARNYLGTALCLPIAMLAAGAGLGGGPLFLPLLIIIVGFSVEYAIPVSKAMILGVSLAQFAINVTKRNPANKETQLLIDYNMAALLEPFTLLGTMIGVFFNVLLPSWFTVLSITLLLLIITSRTTINGIKTWEHESAAVLCGTSAGEPVSTSDYSINEAVEAAEYKALPAFEMQSLWRIALDQWPAISLLGITWLFMFVTTLLKSGSSGTSVIGVARCSWQYWLLVVSAVPFTILVTVAFAVYLRKLSTTEKAALSIKKGSLEWNLKTTIVFPALSLLAGIMAGMMGLGGGMLKGPLLLEVGDMHSVESAAATCAFMIMFTASSTTVQFFLLGRLNLPYALWYGSIGFIGSIIGKLVINALVKRYKKSAYIIVCIVVFLALGCWAMMVEGVGQMAVAFRNHQYFEVTNFCDAK